MEETKWLTKTKIIIFSAIILVIGLVFIFILVHRHNLRKDYINYEKQLEYAAPNYLLKEKISLKENEWREIKVKDILKQKLITNKRSSDCDGYVIASGLKDNSSDTKYTKNISYKAYITCGKLYTTDGYGTKGLSKNENKTKTQTQSDTEKPVLKLFGDSKITLNVGDTYKELGATAMDNIDKDITNKIKITGTVDTTKAGTYKIQYTVQDSSNNKATAIREVIVQEKQQVTPVEDDDDVDYDDGDDDYVAPSGNSNVDRTSPIISFANMGVYSVSCGSKVDASQASAYYSYSAHDDRDGNITSRVKVSGALGNVNRNGVYTINYSVSDSSGNTATATRQFKVENCTDAIPSTDTVIPVSNVTVSPNNRTLNVGGTFKLSVSIAPSNATDKSITYSTSHSNVATIDASGNVRAVGKGTTTVTARASNGRSGSCVVTVK